MAKSTKQIVLICIVINIVSAILVILSKNNLPPLVPLFYGLPVSPNQLVPSNFLILPSIISIIFTLLNITITKFSKDLFLEKLLAGLNLTITILPLITILEIILLVGNF